jgi:YegS/Rv2252/BmrU family lipid kinase
MYDIIVNVAKLQGRNDTRLSVVKAVFERAGREYTFHYTDHPGHAKEIARELTADGEEKTIIAMGGDGTLHEILNGITYVDRCVLGIIPIGDLNDFANAANVPEDVKHAAEIIAFKAPSHIDYIQLSSGLRSINAVGAGMDVDILRRAYSSTRRGKKKYFYAFIASLFGFKSKSFTVKYNDKEEKHKGLLACLGNGTQIGGGIKIFPDAKIDDGYFELVIIDYLSKFKAFKAMFKLIKGKIDGIKEITQVKCKEATFISHDKEYTIQAEGELYNNMPLKAEIVSNKLKFYVNRND